MEAEAAGPLFEQILIKPSYDDNVDEILFPSPVCLTGVTVGAMPGAAPQASSSFVSVFAKDTTACAAARFACLYEGLSQPAAGTTSVQIQPFVTDRVVVRGRYQTVPLTLHGFSLDKAAEGHIPRPETPALTLDAAAPRFPELAAALPAPAPVPATISYQDDAAPALEALVKHWRKVGSSSRKIEASPLPESAWKAVMAAADAVAAKLAAGGTAFQSPADEDARTATAEDHELIDMAMGWTGLLAAVPGVGGRATVACGAAGLAAAVLVCTRASAVSAFLTRHGQLLLADALAAPAAPGSQLRHAASACLLLAQGAGALGCEALLGWWSPSFVQWVAKKQQVQQAQREDGKRGGRRPTARSDAEDSAAAAAAVVPQVDGAGDDAGGRKRGGGKRNGGGGGGGGGKRRRGGGGGSGHGTDADPDDRWDGGGGGGDAVDRYYDSDHDRRDEDLRRQRQQERGRERGRGDDRRERQRPQAEPERPRGDLRQELNRRRQEREKQEKEEKTREERRDKKVESRGRQQQQQQQQGRDADRPPRTKESSQGGDGRKEQQQQRQKEPLERRRSPPPARERPEPRGGGGGGERQRREDREDAAQLHRFTQYWDERLKSYTGVYSPLAKAMTEVRPATTAAVGARLLRLLRFYERAAAFSAAAEDLARQHLPAKRDPAPPVESAAAAATAGAALSAIADALAASAGGGDPVSDAFASPSTATEAGALPAPPEPAPLLLELLAARRVLPLLPALLAVPATLRARGLEDGEAAAAAATAATAMAGDLAVGTRALLAALTSGAAGLRALAAAPVAGAQLLRLLRRPGALEPALAAALAPLGDIFIALAAVHDFLKAKLSSSEWDTAAATLTSLLDGSPSQRLSVLLIASLHAGEVLSRCAEAVEARCALLTEASGMAVAADADPVPDFLDLLDALPALEAAFKLLEALGKEGHPGVASRVAPAAPATLPRLAAAAQRLCGLPAPGASAAYASLEYAIGGLEATVSHAKGGLWAILSGLDAALPPLAAETLLEGQQAAAAAAGDGEDANEAFNAFEVYEGENGDEIRSVDWVEIRGFWDDPRRRGRTVGALQALTAVLWAPRTAGRAAALAAVAEDGQRLVLRAVATAGAALAAAHADQAWVARAGAAIDPAAAASSRRAALEFLEAAAAAASALLQHLRDTAAVEGLALPAALLEAHAELCADEACLAALMGQTAALGPAAATAVAARRHLASALRCYIEAGAIWTPPLLPLILFGPEHARRRRRDSAAPALPPRQLFAASCLLGDLSPEEWPPAGRRPANPLPSARFYRVAFAKSIDSAIEPFRALMAACIEGESPLLRAAAVRALARAAGFGGGMGAFVAGPLLVALEAGLASATAAHDLRKALELLVPLVYRPALKAALLDSAGPPLLAQVLRVMSTGKAVGAAQDAPPQTIDPADGAAISTMALECLVVLCNPDQRLDPAVPPEVAAAEDVPSAPRGIHVASTLLEMLPSLGTNVPLGQRVLRLLAGTPPGRTALRRAVAALHAMSSGDPPPQDPEAKQIAAAAQWVAQRYWGLSQQAQQAGAPGSEAFADVAEIMKEICLTMDADGGPDAPPPPPSASSRFVNATKAAIAAAKAAGLDSSAVDDTRWDRGDYLPVFAPHVHGAAAAAAAAAAAGDFGSNLFDPVTRTFWKNLRARAVPATPAAAAAVLRKYTRHPVGPDEALSVAALLHPPLTHPLRPLVEDMGGEDGEGAGEMREGEDGAAAVQEGQQHAGPSPVAAPPVAVLKDEEMPGADGAEAAVTVEIPAGAVAVAAEPIVAPVVPAEAPPADFDLYEDLGADLGISVPVPVPPSAVPAPTPVPAPQPPPAATPVVEDPATLLADPAKMQELLADPIKMQELLVKHPSLVSALKSKLGGGGGGGSGN